MIELHLINQKLPAGLEDCGAEFYVSKISGDIKCLHAGRTYGWDEIPNHLLEIVGDDLLQHPDAIKSLFDWGISEAQEQLKQYIFCRFGGFDCEPDIDTSGKIDYTEYFDCGKRGACKYEGKICATIQVGDEHLTKRELEVLKLVAQGKLNKEIADLLNISEETVSSHNQNIQRKGNWRTKYEMSAFAISKNLIQL